MEKKSSTTAQKTKRAHETRTFSAAEYRRFARRNKYHAVKTEYNGVKYDSKLEARFAAVLDQCQKTGLIQGWTRQIPFRMPDGSTHRVDFLVFYHNGGSELIEVKGRDLAAGRLKRACVEKEYGLEVTVVHKPEAWKPKGGNQ